MNNKTCLFLCGVIGLMPIISGCRRAAAPSAPAAASSTPPGAVAVSDVAVSDPLFKDRLRGIYDGTTRWRWAARTFSASLDVPPPLNARTDVELDFAVPAELITAVHEVNVLFKVNGQIVGKRHYAAQSRHMERFPVPGAALQRNPALVEVAVDRWGTDRATGRDIGLLAVGLALKHPDSTVLEHDSATELARRGYVELLQRRKMQMTDTQQTEMMKLFHEIPVWSKMWFHNVPIAKNPLDLWMMQQIMYEIQPEFVIETGTWMGGSALYWAHTLNGLGLVKSQVFTCDLGDFTATASKHPLWERYVHFWKGSSTDPAIVGEMARQVKGHRTFVTLDSDHSKAHVLDELRLYGPMVSPGSYLVVEDTHMDGVPTAPDSGPGPMAAVLEFLKEGGSRDFEQDQSREAFVMTFNPGGWLRRK